MIQDHYGKYICDDGDALLRAYVEKPKLAAVEQKTRTFAGTFLHDTSNYRKDFARPTGIEPLFMVPENLLISFSLRARAKFFITGSSISQRALWQLGWPRGPFRRE